MADPITNTVVLKLTAARITKMSIPFLTLTYSQPILLVCDRLNKLGATKVNLLFNNTKIDDFNAFSFGQMLARLRLTTLLFKARMPLLLPLLIIRYPRWIPNDVTPHFRKVDLLNKASLSFISAACSETY